MTPSSCTMGRVGSSVFGAWHILGTESQDISSSAALIFDLFKKKLSCELYVTLYLVIYYTYFFYLFFFSYLLYFGNIIQSH